MNTKTEISWSTWVTHEDIGLEQYVPDINEVGMVEYMSKDEALELADFINKHFGG